MTVLLKARDVAVRLGVEMSTVLDWHQQGKLPAIRLGGGVRGPLRWPEDEVEAALRKWHTGGIDSDGPAPPRGRPGPGTGVGGSHAPRTLRPVAADE